MNQMWIYGLPKPILTEKHIETKIMVKWEKQYDCITAYLQQDEETLIETTQIKILDKIHQSKSI